MDYSTLIEGILALHRDSVGRAAVAVGPGVAPISISAPAVRKSTTDGPTPQSAKPSKRRQFRRQRKLHRPSMGDSSMPENKSYRDLLDSIMPLAKELNALHRQAKSLGIFIHARELLECTGCDLTEDVDGEGRLMTWHRDADEIGTDCGLPARSCGRKYCERLLGLELRSGNDVSTVL